MGFLEAKGQEEGLLRLGFRMFLERGNGQVGLESVNVSVIRHIGRLIGRSIEQAAGSGLSVARHHLLPIGSPKFLILLEGIAARSGLPSVVNAFPGWFSAPGQGLVGHAAMEDFSTVDRFVALSSEMLR